MVLLSLSFSCEADVFTRNQSPGHSPEVIVALVFLELWECKQGKHLTLPINNNPNLTSHNLFESWPFVYQHPASRSLWHQDLSRLRFGLGINQHVTNSSTKGMFNLDLLLKCSELSPAPCLSSHLLLPPHFLLHPLEKM